VDVILRYPYIKPDRFFRTYKPLYFQWNN
jgi:hypothetical protein